MNSYFNIAFDMSPPLPPNDFDGLLTAMKEGRSTSTKIGEDEVHLIRNPLSENNLYMLYIGETMSNSCQAAGMRTLIREWKAGKRHVQGCSDQSRILFKKY